jgi:hypothetical protein
MGGTIKVDFKEISFWRSEVPGIGSGSCQLAVFGISDVESSDSATTVLVIQLVS